MIEEHFFSSSRMVAVPVYVSFFTFMSEVLIRKEERISFIHIPSSPIVAANAVSTPAFLIATAWLAPFPPAEMERDEEEIVSPRIKKRGRVNVLSILIEPNTSIFIIVLLIIIG